MKYKKKLICLVGRNIDYSIAAINIILSRGIDVVGVMGETSLYVTRNLRIDIEMGDCCVVPVRRPWMESAWTDVISKHADAIFINCGFDYILPLEVLKQVKVLNLHPSFLPLNRGCHHSFWAIMDGTLGGATMHWMDAGIDTGNIVTQCAFKIGSDANAEEVQYVSNKLCLSLLHDHILDVFHGLCEEREQGDGTYHSRNQITPASTLNEDDVVSTTQLMKLIRATKSGENGFYIYLSGIRYKIVVKSIEIV